MPEQTQSGKTQPRQKKNEPLTPLKGQDRERMGRLFEEVTVRSVPRAFARIPLILAISFP